MKKLFRYFLVILFLCRVIILTPTKSYGENKGSLWKLIGGIVLTGAGTYLAVDGFKRVDISDPKLDLSNWNWSKEKIISWWVDASGTVKNTGNVPLEDVKIYVTYYDTSNNYLGRDWAYLDTYWLEPLPKGAVDSWDTTGDTGSTEPERAEISAIYTYEKKYETKNVIEGSAGIAVGLVGIYLIYDYFRDLGYFAKLEKKGIDVRLVNRPGSIYLLASGRLF